MPGLRNPEPIPPTNEQCYATVPSDDDSSPATLGDAPEPAADARKPARRRREPES